MAWLILFVAGVLGLKFSLRLKLKITKTIG